MCPSTGCSTCGTRSTAGWGGRWRAWPAAEAPASRGPGKAGSMPMEQKFDLDEIRALLKIASEADITELTVESPRLKVTIKKAAGRLEVHASNPAAAARPGPAGAGVSPAAPGALAAVTPEEIAAAGETVPDHLETISAPMVGTFYRASSPDAPPFVPEGGVGGAGWSLFPNPMFQKVLTANRGEIAVRIIRACHELGVRTVAVYSEADRNSLHVKLADEAFCIGPPPTGESYLQLPNILSTAEILGVDAIHPGYGFLAENAQFAEICADLKIAFIGPSSDAIRKMGDKAQARQLMLKAGGRGMRVVHTREDLRAALQVAQREAEAAFGDGELYIEKYVEEPRHVEVQILADGHGNVLPLGARDCSVQRRHQKLIEESPPPRLREKILDRLARAALRAAQAIP